MLQYEKAAVSNSAFKGDVVYYYDVKEKGERRWREGDEWRAAPREMEGGRERERERGRAREREIVLLQ